jgi:hypothetical protein
MSKIQFLMASIFLGFQLTGCSDDREGGGVAGNFEVASVLSLDSSIQATSYRPTSEVDTTLAAAAGDYSFAKIDGIKVTLNQVRGADAASDNPLTTQDIVEEIELTSDASNPIGFTTTVDWTPGDYAGVDLRMANNWKFKGYCKTNLSGSNYTLVYTTATGVATQSCTTTSCTLPSSYDYYAYDFLDDYYTQNGGDPNLATHFKFTIAEGDTPKVTLLFDAVNTVACWNGESWSSTAAIGAFRGPTTARANVLWTGAAFSVPVLPLMAYVSSDASEENPKARTFFTSVTSSYLTAPIQFEQTETVTILYSADGTPVASTARNLAGTTSSSPLDSDLEGFTANGSGWDFFASGWYWDGTSNPAEFIRNRAFTGFTLPTTQYSVFSVAVTDGEGCGLTKTNQNGSNASRSCANASSTHYWKEIAR